MADKCAAGFPISSSPCIECGATEDDMCGAEHDKEYKPGRYAARLRAKLEQIRTVCTDNSGKDCRHEMALKFVQQIADDALSVIVGH